VLDESWGPTSVGPVDLSGLESGLTDDAVNLAQVNQAPPMRVITESRSEREKSRRKGTFARQHAPAIEGVANGSKVIPFRR
jgi:hypothetical protein